MSRLFRLSALALLIFTSLALVKSPTAHGASVFDVKFRANFQFNILSNGPLGPVAGSLRLPTDTFLDYMAMGSIKFTLDDSDTSINSAKFTDAKGAFVGVVPDFPYTIDPNLQFVGGSLENIVRNGANEIISADVKDLAMRWNLTAFPGSGSEANLFSLEPLLFSGAVTGIPFAVGNVLTGPPGAQGAYLNDGTQNILAAYVQNRTLTVVPEPTTIAILGFGLAGLLMRRPIRKAAKS